ncbi:MAG TPA: hypothetical protein PKX86_05060 [Bacteroidia bacterium]|nr:hypothetical protein [Bacteroidia bacterium]HQW18064.1 hypothetical protein [Bacteroidia bacterium]HQW49384.1 hypothetical protein [Bacteroidia bacterium]HQZ77453.1 hypothetical protein [Bacteroidia bacterium]HRA58818.1 hypothetical protein [Bacteroidia bacterium]
MQQKNKNPWRNILRGYYEMRKTLADDASRMALNEFLENFQRQGSVNANGLFIPWKATGGG